MANTTDVPSGTIRMASIDWLTATADTAVGREEYRTLGTLLAQSEAAAGNRIQSWGWQSYIGWHCGGLTFGERPDGALLRLSGSTAANNWRRAIRWSKNVSRLDLQVTVHFRRFPKTLASTVYHDIAELVTAGLPHPNASLIQTTKGGETLYLGSGASDKLARLYNKAAESEDPAYRNCWRYELELKNRPAKQTATHLFNTPDERPQLTAYVWRHFADRHVPPYFTPELDGGLISVPRTRSTDERALAWLHTQVAAVVQRLGRNGKEEQVRAILGL